MGALTLGFCAALVVSIYMMSAGASEAAIYSMFVIMAVYLAATIVIRELRK